MQCPKCSYENPSGIRYCLNCGTQMIPPVPEEKKPKLREAKKTTLIIITLVMIALFFIGGGVVAALIAGSASHRAANQAVVTMPYDAADSALEDGQTAADPLQEENSVYQFVNFSEQTLNLPDSDLKISLPEFYDYRFDYDKSKQLLVFEIDTYEDQTITFTSSKLNASPFTKSEAEASSKTGLYHEIEGQEDLYYYILPANGPTANATIIDCRNNSSTNITVYDKNYMMTKQSELAFDESEQEDTSYGSDELNGSASSSERAKDSRTSSASSITQRTWQGSQEALSGLEDLLDSTGIES